MSLRNAPYLPLYIQDFLTDEKLCECSPQANGVYIRLMCLMHKSEHYGKILLKQKDKQNESMCLNFASKVAKQMPWSEQVVCKAIQELLDEGVLKIEGDFLVQKRMVKDCELSEKRAKAGKKGGDKSKGKFAQAKSIANSDNEIESNNGFNEERALAQVSQGAKALLNPDGYKLIKDALERQFTNESQIELIRGECKFRGDVRAEIVHFASHYADNGLAKKQDWQILNKFRGWLVNGKNFKKQEETKKPGFKLGDKPTQRA